ncbi:MAG: GDP-mannose 4,6-dehydratase [Thermodesulfobacteriota bacterium]|nr:GDP-mannose 4,6-dehydratase [Thermodesulfobacteriota bacterium]
MKNLITGGAGFVGSHLAEWLLAQGEEVIVLDDLSTGSFDNIRHLVGRDRFTHYVGKVEDERLLERATESVDRIYHLAAAVGVQLIVDDPVRTIETNINASQAVLECAVTYGKRVLITSTSEVYGKGTKMPFSEGDDVVYGPTIRARWSYAISKAVDEFLLLAYHRKKGLPGLIVRLFNTVGPRQTGRYGMVLPRFVQQALSGGPITVYGTGNQTRCFAHVGDVAPALHAIMNCDAAIGRVVNIGSDVEASINELAQRVRDSVDSSAEIVKIPYEEAYGPGFEDMGARKPDLATAKELVGYSPTLALDDIISDVLAFHRGEWHPHF